VGKRKINVIFIKFIKESITCLNVRSALKRDQKKTIKKRGLEHNRSVKRVWVEKQGGKVYMRAVFKKHYEKNSEVVCERSRKYYHKNKKICSQCNKIRPKHYFKNNPDICLECLKLE